MSDSKSPKVSWILISILANPLFRWFYSILYFSSFSNPLFKRLGFIPIGITVILIFHWLFTFLARSKYLHLVVLSFTFNLWSARIAKSSSSTASSLSFFFFGPVFWQELRNLFVSKNPSEFLSSFSITDSGLCICYLVVWSNFNFLQIPQ